MTSSRQEAMLLARSAPVVSVQGKKLSDADREALDHVRIEHGLGLPGRAVLRFRDVWMELAESRRFDIGQEVTIKGGDPAVALFTGFVTAVEFVMEARVPGGQKVGSYVVTADDAAAKLGWTTRTATFLNRSPADVIKAIAAGHSVKVKIQGLTSPTQKYYLQRGTGMAVLNQMVQRQGAVWWTDGDGTLQVAPAAGGAPGRTVSVEYGAQVQDFSLRVNSRQPDSVEVTGWDHDQQKVITGNHRAPADGQQFGKLNGWRTSVAVSDLQPQDASEAKQIAAGLAAEAAASAVTMTATCDFDPALAPRVTLQVKGVGKRMSDSYVLTHVAHVWGHRGFESRVTAGPLRPSGLVDLLGGSDGVFESLGRSLVPAVVTNVSSPDKDGTVKVKYPTMDAKIESAWARIVTLGAGPDRGMVFYPEVNDEVLVAFMNGDPNTPVVIGGLHSEKQKFPWSDVIKDNKISVRRFKSRLGHTLEFGDGEQPAEKHVKLTSKQGKNILRLGDDKLEITVDKVPVVITNGAGAQIEFTNAGDIKIKGKSISIEADTKVEIKAGTELALKATTAFKAEGLNVEVKAQATGKVEAGGPMAVKGAIVQIN